MAPITTSWIASVLVGASLLELAMLRIGTRTAIHIPGLERIAGPYRMFAETGRLMFFAAVVLLALLLAYLVRDLYLDGRTRAAACLSSFVVVAALGGLRLIGNDVMAPAVTVIVAILGFVVLARQSRPVRVVVGLFVFTFLAGALQALLQSSVGGGLTGPFRYLPTGVEVMAVAFAISSGPLFWRALRPGRALTRRVQWSAVVTGLLVTAVILANPSTSHILMLWNIGLTGALPAAIYGLAAASLLVAVVSSFQCQQQTLALALVLLLLGGISLTSTYQSGLLIAGLGLMDLTVMRPGSQLPDAAEPRNPPIPR
jgi:hypothetical protein